MSFSTRYLPAVLLTILSIPTSLWAQAAPKQPTKAPRGSVSGRVTIKEKSAQGVVVSLRRNDFMNQFEVAQRATTDQDGNYRIVNVPPGTYEVTPSAPAFVPSDLKEQRNKTVLVGEDEDVENINFALVRGGVITGRVTDADGRPVIQQQVNIYRVEAFPQQQQSQPRQIYASSSGQTDDRGIYRVFGLMPGRYKVGVGRSDDTFTPSFSAQRSTYQQVFHPDVSDQAKATVIEVGEGTEAKDVDIALGRTLQTFTVFGRVVDEKGLPVPNIRLGLNRNAGQRPEFVSQFPVTNNQGDFVVEGLLPGKYGIYLMPNQSGGMRLETFTFDIIDQDLSGVTVKLVPGSSVSGVVVLEGENKAAIAKFPELQLRAFVTNPGTGTGSLGSSSASPIAPDGSFQLTGLPAGMVNFNLGGLNSPFPARGFIIARIEREGMPVPRSFEVKDGEQVTGIRIVLAYGSGKLRGVLNLDNGVLPNGARFFVRLTKSGQIVSNMRPPEVDARGHFLIEDLPPGVYEIQASVAGLPKMPPVVKREVSVQDGITTDVTITIEMPQIPKP